MSRPGGDFDYAWMDITKFNLAYWSGNTASWTYTINTHLATSSLPRITALNGSVQTPAGQSTKVALTWPAVSGGRALQRLPREPILYSRVTPLISMRTGSSGQSPRTSRPPHTRTARCSNPAAMQWPPLTQPDM